MYSLLYKMHINGTHKSKYLDNIKNMLIDIGLPYLWNDHSSLNFTISQFKSLVKKHLQDLFIQDWFSHIDNDSICETYRMFKRKFAQEPYFTLLPYDCVIELVRFRTINNYLPVNEMRYRNIPRKDRVCAKCGSQQVADEMHYLLYCDFFNNERNEMLLPPQNTLVNDPMNLEKLLNSTNKRQLLKLKHFISIINKEIQKRN